MIRRNARSGNKMGLTNIGHRTWAWSELDPMSGEWSQGWSKNGVWFGDQNESFSWSQAMLWARAVVWSTSQ